MHLKASAHSSFPVELIMDGKIMKKNLDENGVSEEWLMGLLRHKGKELSDIFYAVRSTSGKVVLDDYQDELQLPIDIE